jgi:hypothetical protein
MLNLSGDSREKFQRRMVVPIHPARESFLAVEYFQASTRVHPPSYVLVTAIVKMSQISESESREEHSKSLAEASRGVSRNRATVCFPRTSLAVSRLRAAPRARIINPTSIRKCHPASQQSWLIARSRSGSRSGIGVSRGRKYRTASGGD